MAVNHEIKSQLAKLLATEDLVVEHKQIETACFNVHTRVLTLPMWEKASGVVYDMLVGHEVGHALYTPDIDWLKEYNIPPQFVNVVEDARIEKLMKRRYAGLSKTFYNGYKELSEEDFFQIADEDVSTMNLADRANLWFKIGNYTQIPIEEGEEMELINMIADTETFADVLIAAESLYKFCKKKQQEETKTSMDDLESQTSGSQQTESEVSDQQGGESMTHEEMLEEAKHREEENDLELSDAGGGKINEELEVKTIDSLEEALKDLINNNGIENVYLELPKVDLEKIIIPNETIHSGCKEFWNDWNLSNEVTNEDVFGFVDKKFFEFKKSAQKEVNYLVKEFECRKSADSYARATTARTGVLDCAKLHTYKYNEDLFKKVTTLADGKNHGLVFVLDWSGSMGNVMLDTIKQLYNLIWFCKKVGIPFDVYAFTNEYPAATYDENGRSNLRPLSYKKREGLVQVGDWFSMMNILTSKSNSKDLQDQMVNIFRIAYSFSTFVYYQVPLGMGLSGTPLNEALISLHQILPKFKKEHKLQKVQCVVLTDGESCSMKYHKEFNRRFEDGPFMGTASICHNAFLRDRKTGKTYSFDCEWYGYTDVLLENLKDSFLDMNFIGIRVIEPRDAKSFIRRYCGYHGKKYDAVEKDWKKLKSFNILTSGYHSYLVMSASTLSQNSEFSPSEDATKTQIKSAFIKSLKTKKMNKKILNKFVELVS